MANEIDAITAEFNEAFAKFENDNPSLIRMKMYSAEYYRLTKRIAETFYFLGRGDQAAVDAANLLLIGDSVDDLHVLDGGES